MTIISYVLTLLALIFSFTSIPMLILAPFGRFFGGVDAPAFLGGVASWAGVSYLWSIFEGNYPPLLLFALALAWCLLQSANRGLNTGARRMVFAETSAIIVICVIVQFVSPSIRWI